MQTETMPVDISQQNPKVKKPLKKKEIKVKKEKVVKTEAKTDTSKSTTTKDVSDTLTDELLDDGNFIIPSSRIKNYINKEKLNTELDSLIEKIKSLDDNTDLNTYISEDLQKKIGSAIKDKETHNINKPDDKKEFTLKSVTVEVLSKQRCKFSNDSFKILSAFSDMIIEEITKYAMDELVKCKKSIINNKYVFTSAIENGNLYNVYSKFPSFVNMKAELAKQVDLTNTQAPEEDSTTVVEKPTKGINFEFYIRKICNKLKGTNPDYLKIKVSEKYQKFCSNLILDFLDEVAPLSKIILEVMTTKTITDVVFNTIVKIQLLNCQNNEAILAELKKRANIPEKSPSTVKNA